MNTNETTTDWPYTRIKTIALAAATLLALAWLLTHDGCMHPLGNTIALIIYAGCGAALATPWAVRKLGPYLTEDDEQEEE
ncbi:hypothetical protein BLI708_08465 [Bifidobacterium imperatoris]|uniref:Uncharacterized protein n=1 Tax=Bifidobacterium imperatoris TaxID=2020965 RepID=A0A2N5IQL3_9BIFI|nr:hypothetical protein [Bifidobacterium imperatoris]PLS24243.1 hypothetical protein Tam1G_1820 [Bifidobacterium imperatoris]QSY57265.1 hypothetical protein BLI708_08465 [Bifidobacterium imperatoris]